MRIKSISSFLLLAGLIILSSCTKKNHPPEIYNQQYTVAENSSPGTIVGKVIATDPDMDTTLTYSITAGNTGDAFDLSSKNGTITIKNEDPVDFETNPTFNLSVQVKDSKNAIASAKVTINLENVSPPTDGLILYYPFDGNMIDSSTSLNDGINFTSGNYVQGRWGEGLDFNGTTDYLRLTKTLDVTNGLSFSFWMKSRGPNGLENNGAIICKYSSTNSARCFMVYSFGAGTARTDNRLSAAFYKYPSSALYHDQTKSYWEPADLLIFPTDPSYWAIINPQRIPLNTWTHVVVNVTSHHVEVWFNGVICTTKQREYTTYSDSPYEPVFIGDNLAAGDGTNNHFNGILDEMRVYYRALTPKEIKTLYREK
jgi:hypothetical protein